MSRGGLKTCGRGKAPLPAFSRLLISVLVRPLHREEGGVGRNDGIMLLPLSPLDVLVTAWLACLGGRCYCTPMNGMSKKECFIRAKRVIRESNAARGLVHFWRVVGLVRGDLLRAAERGQLAVRKTSVRDS